MRGIVLIAIIFLVSCSENKKESQQPGLSTTDSIRLEIQAVSAKIRKEPTNDELFSRRADLYFNLEMLDSAINDLEIASRLNPQRIGYLLRRADMELLRGQPEMTKTLLMRILEKYPNHEEANLKLANLYMILDELDAAETILNRILKAEKNHAVSLFMRSMIHQMRGDYAKALDDLKMAVYYKPDYYDAQNMLGLLYSYQHNDLAIDYYKNAINLQPNNIEPRYNLGFYYQETGRTNEALEVYRQILQQIDSTALDPLFNIGYIYQEAGKYNESIKYFSKAAKYHSYEARVFYRLGLSYEKLNQPDSAIANYRKTLSLDPEFDEAFEAIDNLTRKNR